MTDQGENYYKAGACRRCGTWLGPKTHVCPDRLAARMERAVEGIRQERTVKGIKGVNPILVIMDEAADFSSGPEPDEHLFVTMKQFSSGNACQECGLPSGVNCHQVLEMYVIYEHPKDFPSDYVLRRWLVGKKVTPQQDAEIRQSLDDIHELIPADKTLLPSRQDDDPSILEVWI